MTDWEAFGFDTCAIRAGQVRSHEGEHSESIMPTSSFVFKSAEEAAARFSQTEEGNIYSRFTNPTVRTFEQRLAALEGGERCIATSSGMAAILSMCLGLLKAGDHIVASQSIFGSTISLFNGILKKFSIDTDFVPLTDIDAWEQAIQGNTKLLFLETPSNPIMEVADLRQLAALAHKHGCLLVVDNCLCTPALQQPLKLGADIVIHSATKYIDGQGRCLGGAIVGSDKLLGDGIFSVLRSGGATMSPFNAWVFTKGLETLKIRMRAHCDNAAIIAEWLVNHPKIEAVYYPGLSTHPQHQLAAEQQNGFGGLVSFVVKGGKIAAWQVVDNTEMISITGNLGDVKTTITHPATTTHGRITDAERSAANISDGLLRLSVGLEEVDDIKADLLRGLQQL